MAELYNLRDDMVEMVEYPADLRTSVEQAAETWEQFCGLSSEIKEIFAADDPQITIGYENKDGTGSYADRKENFDFSFSQAGVKSLEDMMQRADNDTAQRFVVAVKKLQQQMMPTIEAFGERVEGNYGVSGFADTARRSAPHAFFRFLHYPSGTMAGGTIAEPHVDHSGFTFHLYETTEGCERLTRDGQWKSLPVANGQAAAFASMQIQLVSGGEIKAMTHRVIANEKSAEVGRYAIVCFVALDGVPAYDRKTHGRLQEKEPGFNYEMPFDEFRRLFA